MSESKHKTPVPVAVYSDYICPFCYIGFLRLEKLRAEQELEIDWRFLEIHPDNPEQGKPVSEFGYPPHHWKMLMANFTRMAEEEGVSVPERTFTTNSRRALKLAQAVREQQPTVFDVLNRELYEAYFLRRENIADPPVLESLARACGVEPAVVECAWSDAHFEQVLRDNHRSAARLQITGTPTYVFGERVYSGAIPLDMLRRAMMETAGEPQP